MQYETVVGSRLLLKDSVVKVLVRPPNLTEDKILALNKKVEHM